jgi:23S rRNA G2069 N7-methylase RlmK/C1962 C5-methylase RlmI
MSNTQTSITVSSRNCEHACLKAIEDEREKIKQEWEKRIKEEMSLPPFLWLFPKAAKTRKEAIDRIKRDAARNLFGCEPGWHVIDRIYKIENLLAMCQTSSSIVLSHDDFCLIGRHIPKLTDSNYRM